jgi:serine protease AprX
MSRIRAVLRLSGDTHVRHQQLAYLAEREITVLREAGLALWVSCTDAQLPRLTEQGIVACPLAGTGILELPALAFDPTDGEPEPPAALAAPAGHPYWLVLFVAPAAPEWLAQVAALGGVPVGAVRAQYGVFRFDEAARPVIAALGFVAWTGPYHPGYAIDFALTTRGAPFTASTLRDLQVSPDALPDREQADGNLRIGLMDDVDLEEMRTRIERTGAVVRSVDRWAFVVSAEAEHVQAVARTPGVVALEAHLEPELRLDHSRIIIATDQVAQGRRRFLIELNGAGEIGGLADSGLDTGVLATIHPDLNGRVIALPGMLQPDTADLGHGTHVAGIIAGNGFQSQLAGAPTVGIAPAAFLVPQPLGGAVLIRNLMLAYRAGVRCHNNSWGVTAVTQNVYNATRSEQLDRFLFTHPDMLVVFAAGNEETDAGPADGALDMNWLDPHTVAKNILCVGASENVRNGSGSAGNYQANYPGRFNHANFTPAAAGGAYSTSDNASEVALFSSRGVVNTTGLVSTGRVRPSLVAPGTNIVSLHSRLVAAPAGSVAPPAPLAGNDYRIGTGSSMAAPHVTGAGLLARQFYRSFFRLLRRPRLLEEVPSGVLGSTPTQFSDLPAVCPHVDGVVMAWITPVDPALPRLLMANRASTALVPVNAVPLLIGTAIGPKPSPRLARHGDATLVLHRHNNNGIQLRRLARDLSLDATFGTAGTVSVTAAASTTSVRPCALRVVGDQVAVAWVEDGAGVLRFRLYNAITGAAVGPVRDLGSATSLSPHGAIAHDGTGFALVWIDSFTATHHRLRFQRLDAAGAPVGSSTVLVDEPNPLRDPHLAWDAARNRYLLVWCEETGGGADLRLRFLDSGGVVSGFLVTPLNIPAGRTCRRPYITPHPVHGAVLAWEDDTLDGAASGNYDVFLTILDGAGNVQGGIPASPDDPAARSALRISDTPLPTGGFAASTAADGATVVVWQSSDEINSDRRGSYAVAVTPDGTVQAQVDPNTPLIRSGAYVDHTLTTRAATPFGETVSACWAGGQRFLTRVAPQVMGVTSAELVRTSADGVADAPLALPATADVDRHSLLWTGNQVLAVAAPQTIGAATVHVFDANGVPVAGLAPRTLRERTQGRETPELGFVPGAAPQVLVGYQAGAAVTNRIRMAVLNAATLADVGAAEHDLVPALAAGHLVRTARHGWFQYVNEENLVLAAFTDVQGAAGTVRIARTRRNPGTGAFTRQADVPLTAVAGQSMKAVIAPRPVDVLANAGQRQHMAAFQFRASATDPWEIRVSRLDRDGTVFADLPAPAPPRRDIQVIFPAAPGWAAATDATDPQLVCTFLDEPLTDPPAGSTAQQVMRLWSPSFGLAFLGRPTAGGNRTLHFTLLDEHGRRVMVPPPPNAPPGVVATPVPIHPISATTADVLDFTLSWTGRYFWLTWVESEGGMLRHCQTAVTRNGSRMAYDAPSAALIRATLLNGARNITVPVASPPNLVGGSGWGRLDLRQSLSPTPPVTFHARDDAVASGSTLTYDFELPAGTEMLRVMLTWDDPPGAAIQRPVTLHVTPPTGPAGQEYRGNQWDPASLAVSGLVAAAAVLPPVLDNVQQVVVRTPPAGRWRVQVRGGVFNVVPEFQFPAQGIALVFAGSGREVPFTDFTNRHPPVI